jgi:hypothetical protein
VSNVLNHPELVVVETCFRVSEAMTELDCLRGRTPEETAAHWRRSAFGSRLFHPAATGKYRPEKDDDEERVTAVPILAEP